MFCRVPRPTYILGKIEKVLLMIRVCKFNKHICFLNHTENATTEIQKQDVDRKKSHRRILEDLNKIRNKAEEVWNKIGN